MLFGNGVLLWSADGFEIHGNVNTTQNLESFRINYPDEL
jgi:hypothetical protein